MWPGGAFNFVAKDTVGLSGGLIIIWDADELDAILSFSGTAFIGVCVKKKNSTDVYFLVNALLTLYLGQKERILEGLAAL